MKNGVREGAPEYHSTRLHLSEITTSENKIGYHLKPGTITIDGKKIYRSVTQGNLNLKGQSTKIWISGSHSKNLRYFKKGEGDNLSHIDGFDNKPLTNFVRRYFETTPEDIVEATESEVNNIIAPTRDELAA